MTLAHNTMECNLIANCKSQTSLSFLTPLYCTSPRIQSSSTLLLNLPEYHFKCLISRQILRSQRTVGILQCSIPNTGIEIKEFVLHRDLSCISPLGTLSNLGKTSRELRAKKQFLHIWCRRFQQSLYQGWRKVEYCSRLL